MKKISAVTEKEIRAFGCPRFKLHGLGPVEEMFPGHEDQARKLAEILKKGTCISDKMLAGALCRYRGKKLKFSPLPFGKSEKVTDNVFFSDRGRMTVLTYCLWYTNNMSKESLYEASGIPSGIQKEVFGKLCDRFRLEAIKMAPTEKVAVSWKFATDGTPSNGKPGYAEDIIIHC